MHSAALAGTGDYAPAGPLSGVRASVIKAWALFYPVLYTYHEMDAGRNSLISRNSFNGGRGECDTAMLGRDACVTDEWWLLRGCQCDMQAGRFAFLKKHPSRAFTWFTDTACRHLVLRDGACCPLMALAGEWNDAAGSYIAPLPPQTVLRAGPGYNPWEVSTEVAKYFCTTEMDDVDTGVGAGIALL